MVCRECERDCKGVQTGRCRQCASDLSRLAGYGMALTDDEWKAATARQEENRARKRARWEAVQQAKRARALAAEEQPA